jgi:hypothetical protein
MVKTGMDMPDGVELVDPRTEVGEQHIALSLQASPASTNAPGSARFSHGPGGMAENGGKRLRSVLGDKSAQASKYAVLSEDDQGAYSLPARPTIGDYCMHPYRGLRQFAHLLGSNFGWKFVGMIVCNYFGVKGLLLSIMGLLRLSYCKKTLGIDGSQCQTMGAIAMTPWAIKGAIGVLSDAYPFFGYHKASYIISTAVMGSIAYMCLATFRLDSPTIASALLFLANLQIATADLLCEGKYASLMQAKPQTGSAMVSLVWGCFQMGSLLAACLVGPVADHFNPQVLFWVCLPLAASIILPTARGWLGDQRVPHERRGFNWALIHKHPYMVTYCLIMAAAALCNGIIDTVLFDNHGVQLTYALTAAAGLSILAFLWLPKQLARCNFYMFVSSFLYVNVGGAQDFWFTADEVCVPGGPGFDYTYYNTYTAIVGSITGWVGIVLFQATMSGWSFRRLFWVTTVLQVVASAFDLLMIARVNRAMGISDKLFYMLGDAVIGPAVGMFSGACVCAREYVLTGEGVVFCWWLRTPHRTPPSDGAAYSPDHPLRKHAYLHTYTHKHTHTHTHTAMPALVLTSKLNPKP